MVENPAALFKELKAEAEAKTLDSKREIRILLLVNTLHDVSSYVYSNHINMLRWMGIKYPNVKFLFFTPPRMSIDNARNTAAQAALVHDCDYLAFIDDDVLVPHDAIEKLILADKDIIAGLVVIRGYPFDVMLFKYKEHQIKDANVFRMGYFNDIPVDENGDPINDIEDVDAVGFSCALIKTDLLKAMKPPYFITGKFNTEDVYFCVKARKEIVEHVSICGHMRVQPGHLLNPEPVEWKTRKKFQKFYAPETLAEEGIVPTNEGRNLEYLEACLKNVEVVNAEKVLADA